MSSFVTSNLRLLELTLLGADLVSVCFSHRRGRSRIDASFDQGLTDWDVPFQSQFLSLGFRFFCFLSESRQSQSEVSHHLAVGLLYQKLDCQSP